MKQQCNYHHTTALPETHNNQMVNSNTVLLWKRGAVQDACRARENRHSVTYLSATNHKRNRRCSPLPPGRHWRPPHLLLALLLREAEVALHASATAVLPGCCLPQPAILVLSYMLIFGDFQSSHTQHTHTKKRVHPHPLALSPPPPPPHATP